MFKRILVLTMILAVLIFNNNFIMFVYANEIENSELIKENSESIREEVFLDEEIKEDKIEEYLTENYEVENDVDERLSIDDNIYSEEQNEFTDNVSAEILQEEMEEDTMKIPSVAYQSHIQNIGWQDVRKNGEMAGTSSKSLRLESIKINVSGFEEQISVKYQAYIQNIGWQSWKSDGDLAGTQGQSLRLEAIKIILDGTKDYSIVYRTHVQEIGWTSWKADGEISGTVGKGYRIEAIQIKIVKTEEIKTTYNNSLHILYSSHIQDIGWQDYISDGRVSGTSGQSLRLEGIKIDLIDAPQGAKVKYRTHIQNIGWQGWKDNDQLSGTSGQSLRLEAIQIVLENLDEYTIEYQVHIQDQGWTDWYIDGEVAGTVGQSKRLEAIRLRIVPKYKRRYFGIDVSRYNSDIDWNSVKNSGVDFAMIRVGFRGYGQAGNFALDSKFKENIEGAKKAGLKVGIYFVTQAVNDIEAIEEANWVIDKIKAYKIDMPVAIDVEYSGESNHNGRADHIDKATRTSIIKVFCKNIQNAGYTPMVYLNVDWATKFVNMSQLTNYDTWIAHYRNNPDLTPNYNGSYTMWQYTSSGSVSGVNGDVDCNICYKKYW